MNDFKFDKDAIWTAILTALFPPVGIGVMLVKYFKKKTLFDRLRRKRNFGISSIICGIVLTPIWWQGILAAITGAALLFTDKVEYDRDLRFRKYAAIIGENSPVMLSYIASRSNESLDTVTSDLETMIRKGQFGPSTYIDHARGCIVVDGVDNTGAAWSSGNTYTTYNTYNTYNTTEVKPDYEVHYDDPFAAQKTEEPKAEPVKEEPKPEPEKAPEKEQENETDMYGKHLLKLRELNDKIEDKVISDRIDSIEYVVSKIFQYVRRNPEKKDSIRKLMNYYLPTTFKLLETYALMEEEGIEGENVTDSKRQINDILEKLEAGFKKQYDMLTKDQAMDISAEINVLKTMLETDGLEDGGMRMKPSGRKG